jgi:hypothetical protein
MQLRSYARRAETGRLAGLTLEADVVRSHGRPRIQVTKGDDVIVWEEPANIVVIEPGCVIGLRDARLLDLRVMRASRGERANLRRGGYALREA